MYGTKICRRSNRFDEANVSDAIELLATLGQDRRQRYGDLTQEETRRGDNTTEPL